MPQLKTNTVTVTNGSNAVTGSGTAWLTGPNPVPVNAYFIISDEAAGSPTTYEVQAAPSDTSLTLTTPWAGNSGTYNAVIHIDFLPNGIPVLVAGDLETVAVVNRAHKIITDLLTAGASLATETEPGLVEKATTAEAQAGTADKFPDAAGVHAAIKSVGATETEKGSVEKATTAEAQAGTADKFPDAAGVHAAIKSVGATETEKGSVEKATTAEAQAGTADKFPDAAGMKAHVDARLHKEIAAGTLLTVGGTADALTLTSANMPAASVYTVGAKYRIVALSNNTGAMTATIDGLTALTVTNVTVADTIVAGVEYELEVTSGTECTIKVAGGPGLTIAGGGLETETAEVVKRSGPVIAQGVATFTNSNNNINLEKLGIHPEAGDVLLIAGSTNNNGAFTAEFITDNDNIIVNAAHAGGTGGKSLVDEVASVTVILLCKWFNAQLGLGQDWVSVSRVANQTYTGPENRTIKFSTYIQAGAGNAVITINDKQAYVTGSNFIGTMQQTVPANAEYYFSGTVSTFSSRELR